MKELDYFIQNVMCRRQPNQHKADKLWKLIKPHIKNAQLFETEWSHYILGELTPNQFSFFVKEYLR